MANVPRRHHYTPKFCLEHFTDADGRLHIVQRDTGTRWAAQPANTGPERDFYTLEDVPAGEGPAFIEKAFSKFEGEAAAGIGEIIDNRVIPKDKDKEVIPRCRWTKLARKLATFYT
jgi:hypothetical protein